MKEPFVLRALFQHCHQIVIWTSRINTERTGVADGDPHNMGSVVPITRYSVSVTDHCVFRGDCVDTSDSHQG